MCIFALWEESWGDLVDCMKRTVGGCWADSSVSKVFCLESIRPEFNFPGTHMKKLGSVTCAYSLSTEEVEASRPGAHWLTSRVK